MEKVRKTYHQNREILILDYSDCRGDALIDVFEQGKALVISEGKKNILVLSVFNNKTHISQAFMRHLEKEVLEVDEFIIKNAIVGLTKTQDWILKGMNLWYKRQIFSFNSREEALEFLVKEEV